MPLPKEKLYYKYLIVVVDYLSIGEIIVSMLDGAMFCGFASTSTYADGNLLLPLEFTGHDIAHGNFSRYVCNGQNQANFESVQVFYDFCENTLADKKQFYFIKFIIFYILHESTCGFFGSNSAPKLVESILRWTIENLDNPIERFLNDNDLAKSIPPPYRGSVELITSFLNEAATLYIAKSIEWQSTVTNPTWRSYFAKGGYRIKRCKKTKKNKYRKSKKTIKKYH